ATLRPRIPSTLVLTARFLRRAALTADSSDPDGCCTRSRQRGSADAAVAIAPAAADSPWFDPCSTIENGPDEIFGGGAVMVSRMIVCVRAPSGPRAEAENVTKRLTSDATDVKSCART